MSVWDQTHDDFAGTLVRSALRLCGIVCLVAVLLGPVLFGGWMASVYVAFRTGDEQGNVTGGHGVLPSLAEFPAEATIPR